MQKKRQRPRLLLCCYYYRRHGKPFRGTLRARRLPLAGCCLRKDGKLCSGLGVLLPASRLTLSTPCFFLAVVGCIDSRRVSFANFLSSSLSPSFFLWTIERTNLNNCCLINCLSTLLSARKNGTRAVRATPSGGSRRRFLRVRSRTLPTCSTGSTCAR